MFPSLKAVRDSLDASYFAAQQSVESHAQNLYKQSPAEAAAYLTRYSTEKAQQMLARWQQLAVHIIVKYNDMVVKPEKSGRFLRTATGLAERPQRPGYPTKYAREMLKRGNK